MKINISETLKELRKEKGINQKDLATVLSVSPQSVSRWEKGISYPDIEQLPEIAKYFSVTVDELMGIGDGGIRKLNEELKSLRMESTQSPYIKSRIRDVLEKLIEKGQHFFLGEYFSYTMEFYKNGAISFEEAEKARDLYKKYFAECSTDTICATLPELLGNEVVDFQNQWQKYIPTNTDITTWNEALLHSKLHDSAYSEFLPKVLFERITGLVTYLLKPHYVKYEDSEEFSECYNLLEHIKTAEILIDIVSRNECDIFIDYRLDVYIAYYRWYLKEGKNDDVFRVITKITSLFDIMYDMYKEKALLYGSSEMFSSFERTFTKEQVDYMIHKLDMDIFEGYFESVKDSEIFKDYDRKLRYLMNGIYDVKYKSSTQKGVTEEMLSMYEDAKKMLKEVDYSREYSALVLTTAEGRRYNVLEKRVDRIECENELIEKLVKDNDTEVRSVMVVPYLGHFWSPTRHFQDELLKLNEKNTETRILYRGPNGLYTSQIIKRK